MNRTIKFRAWDKEEKIMVLLDEIGVCHEYSHLSFSSSQKEFQGICEWPLTSGGMENQIIMQFTGLLDKNGKEIYEGDLIKFVKNDESVYHRDFVFPVVWNNEKACFEPDFNHGQKAEKYEIIGDIYTTPDLLTNQ